MLKLEEYPAAIANQEQLLLKIDEQICEPENKLAQLIAEIETAIAFDESFKNDLQRKSKLKLLLQSDPIIAALQNQLNNLKQIRTQTQITLSLLTNEFSVLKLKYRGKISGFELLNKLEL